MTTADLLTDISFDPLGPWKERSPLNERPLERQHTQVVHSNVLIAGKSLQGTGLQRLSSVERFFGF